MRILFLGNNWMGLQVLKWLKDGGEHVVGLVVHPAETMRFREEVIEASALSVSEIFDGSQLRQREVLEGVRALAPDIGLSVGFGYILKPELLDVFPHKCVNLHTALLPYNRGGYPNVWSIVERTPAGVSLHHIDSGIDTGHIIAQREVAVEAVDTGETLYRKLERAGVELFKEQWPLVRSGGIAGFSQDGTAGTYHRDRDVEKLDHIVLDKMYRAGDLVDILRARTFPPYPGAYFVHEGRKVYMRLQLMYDDGLSVDKSE